MAQLLGGVKDIDGVPWMELEDAFTVELWDLLCSYLFFARSLKLRDVKGRHKLPFLGLLWIEYGILTREKKRLKTFHSDDGRSLNVVYQTHLVVFKS